MEKTEERKFFSDKLFSWIVYHKKNIWLSSFAIYIILVIIFVIITINMNGGIQSTLDVLNDYPEQKYQQLEQEMQNIVVDLHGIYPAKLSSDSIKFHILYNNSEGKYIITLTDEVTITGTIGKDFKKEEMIIEREYQTASEYRKHQYFSTIYLILLIPILPLCCIAIIIHLIILIILLIEFLFKRVNSHKTAKK